MRQRLARPGAVETMERTATPAIVSIRETGVHRRSFRLPAIRVGAGLGILLVWQLFVMAFEPHYIARPTGVISRLPSVLSDTVFLADVRTTLAAVLEGLVIAIVLGTIIGLVMGRLSDVHRALGMYVSGFYAMPIIALVPLLTVWFGYTPKARLAVVALEAILPVIYNVAEGARAVPSTYIDVTRIHRAPWWRVWFGVALPASLPYVLGGIDLAIGRALIGAVVAEFIAAISGLGYYVLFNVRSFHQNEAIVALLVLVAFAIGLRALVNIAVTRAFRWYRPL